MTDRPPPSVVFVDTELTRVFGGAQVFLGRALPGLVAKGWRVTLVTEGTPLPPLVGDLRAAGISVEESLWRYPSTVASAGRRLGAWVNRRADAAYVVSVSSGIGWAALPHLDPSIATLGIAHSDTGAFYEPMSHYRPVLTAAIGVSAPIAEHLRRDLAGSPVTVAHVPYGVPLAPELPDKPNASQASLEVVFVGRFSEPDKRFSDVVAIASAVAGPTVHVTLVGDGEGRGQAESALREQVAAGHVHLTGWLSPDAAQQQLSGADVILFTSPEKKEGLPLALIEGMGMGLVPVVSDIPAFRAALGDDDVGFLVPVGDVDQFCTAITRLRDDPATRLARQRRSWAEAQRYSIESMVAHYDEVLSESVTRATAHPRPRLDGVYPLMSSCRSRYPFPLPQVKIGLRRIRAAWSRTPDRSAARRPGRGAS